MEYIGHNTVNLKTELYRRPVGEAERKEMETNCYRLAGDGRLLPGIPTAGNNSSRYVKLGDRECVQVVPLLTGAKIQREELIEAAPGRRSDHPVLQMRNGWKGAFVTVCSRGLRFANGVGRSMGCMSNVWVGLEQVRAPFAHAGIQFMLAAIEDGEACFAADRDKRFLRLSCQNGRLTTSPAESEELAKCLVERARARIHTHAGLTWTRHAITSLGHPDLWPDDLSRRLFSLGRRQAQR